MNDAWAEIAENLKKMLDSGTFKVWIAPLAAHVEGRTLHVTAPNAYMGTWLEGRLLPVLREAAAPVMACSAAEVTVQVSIATAPEGQGVRQQRPPCAEASPRQEMPATQAALPLSLGVQPLPGLRKKGNWRHSFEDFVAGPSNQVALAAAQDVCREDGCVQTLFINSASGLGKTHLAQAVGWQASGLAEHRVAYLTAEEFASRFVAAQRSRDVEGFKARLQDLDLLLLEDVHFFQHKEGMQNMALTIIKALLARGGRLVCTSSFAPRDLQEMDDQLISYFCSGILAQMERPTEAMRRDILQNKARLHQVLLPDAVCDLLASRLHGDIRQLESCLNSLVFKARLLNCGLSSELAMDVLQQYTGMADALDMPAIVRLICELFGVSEQKLRSRSRQRDCVNGRNTAFFLARKHTDMTLAEIGDYFNRRHSTVISGITAVENEISRESRHGRQLARAVELAERSAGLRG